MFLLQYSFYFLILLSCLLMEANASGNPLPEIVVNSQYCDSSPAFLNLTEEYELYTWSNGSSDDNIVVYTDGIYGVTVTDLSGCTASTDINIEFYDPLNPVIMGETEICDNDFTVLYVDDVYEVYEWSNGLFSDQIPVTEAGIYTITVVDSNGCTGTADYEVKLKAIEKPEIIGGNKICLGGNLVLSIEHDYESVEWSSGATSNEITVFQPGGIFVVVTDQNGCTANSSIYVSQYLFTETYSFEITCDPDREAVIVEDFIDDNGCNAINLHHIILDTLDRCQLEYEIDLENERCEYGKNASVRILVNEAYLELGISLLDSLGNELINYTLNNLSDEVYFDGLSAGQYLVRFTNEFGLQIEELINLEEEPALAYQFEESHSLQIGQSVDLSFEITDGNLESINWYESDSVLLCENCDPFTAMPVDTTLYTVELIDLHGCTSREQIWVNIESNKNIYIPNVFRPKSDFGNALFTAYGPGLKRIIQLAIYDRWGNIIYNGGGSEASWNGYIENKLAQSGVYIYKIELQFYDGLKANYHGQLNLVQ